MRKFNSLGQITVIKYNKAILTALGVFIIVGSALATNSTDFGTTVYCGVVQGADANTPDCPKLTNRSYTASASGTRWCTTDPIGTCSTRANVIVQE
jgi:hypothetical protein